MSRRRPTAIDEMVPLAERLRYLQLVRLLLTAAFLVYVAVVPEARQVPHAEVRLVVAAYAVGSTLAHLLWHASGVRGITLFGAMIVTDGMFLACAGWAAGGTAGPVRAFALVHLVTVALLASYRTAVKIAVWHSILAVVVLHAGRADIVPAVRPPAFGTEAEQLVGFVALAWAVAIATAAFAAVNERELRRRKVDLEDLARLAAALDGATTPRTVAATLRDGLVDAFGFPRTVVLLVEGTDVVVAAGSESAEQRHAVDAADAVLADAWSRQETMLLGRLDAASAPHLFPLFDGARNLLVVPLCADGKAIGAVVAEHGLRRGSRIERRVVEMVERFCDHASLALRTTTLLEQLRAVAASDGLTGVANRRTFDDTLRRELARSTRSGEPTSLVMVDIDHFKQLNDRYGHQAGDAVLRAVAASCRAVDLVARYGGEEFAVVLPDCSTGYAHEAAERLRTALKALDFDTAVTASFGVATFPYDATSAESLVAAADAALYEAKRQGRDRVVVASAALARH